MAKPVRCNTYKKHRGWGGREPLLTIPKLATRHSTQVLSFHTLAHSFALFCIRQKVNSFVFNRFRTLCEKDRGWGTPLHRIGRARENTLVEFVLSLLPYLFTSLLPETATPFPQRWSCCEKGVPSSGEKTVRWKIQFPGGGGGASVTPLNLCMCIPWLPIVTV
jgi:hypothetical protein